MNKETEKLIKNIEECDSLHNNCDYLLDHDECYILIEYINNLKQALNEIREFIISDKALIGCDDNDKELFLRDYACSNYILQIINKVLGDEK